MSKRTQAFDSDPSMDDILSSIRSIITDDVKKTAGTKSVKRKAPDGEADASVLELTSALNDDGTIETIKREDSMGTKTKTPKGTSHLQEVNETEMDEAEFEVELAPELDDDDTDPDLISEGALSESIEALQGLDLISERTLKSVGSQFDSSKTVEALMVDILRPMLKDWIAANLPSLIKVIVNEQVEKVMQARLGSVPSGRSFSSEDDE